MIALPPVALPQSTQTRLQRYQSEVDALPTYPERVAEAQRLWKLRNTGQNAAFQKVRASLEKMCSGQVRCCYCEDSRAIQIEHIHPKSLYPEFVFAWENFLYACGGCNLEKLDRHCVFPSTDATWVEVRRLQKEAVVPPPAGAPVLINPRFEDPFTFLLLDLTGTFYFLPLPHLDIRNQTRAKYTIDVLGLNRRPDLVESRRHSLTSYIDFLHRYARLKEEGAPSEELEKRRSAIVHAPNVTVWQEMKRWYRHYPGRLTEIDNLFAIAPEALVW